MRTQRSVLNFASGSLFLAIALLTSLASTPLLLRWLGEERFGAFRAATDWYGYLILLELGLGGALLPLVARSVGREDVQAVHHTLAAGIRTYGWMSVGMLVVGLVLTANITRLIPVDTLIVSDLQQGCLVGLLGILYLPLSPFRALAEATQRSYLVHGFLFVQSLLITGIALALARAGWGITGQFTAVALGGLPFFLCLAWDGLHRFPGLLRCVVSGKLMPDTWHELWNLNVFTWVMNFCGRVCLLTDNILIAGFLGPTMVVPFSLTQRLILLVQGQLQGIGNASWAALAELHTQGHHEIFRHRLQELTSLVAVLGVAVLAPIAAYNHHFVRMWVGNDHFGGHLLGVVAAMNAYLLAIISLWNWCVTGTGQVRQVIPTTLAMTVVNLGLSIVLTQVLGLAGPLLGTLGGFLTVGFWGLPLVLRRLFGVPCRLLLKVATIPLIWGLPYTYVVWWIAHHHKPSGWLGLIMEMAITALFSLVLSWLMVFTSTERSCWVARLRHVLHSTPTPHPLSLTMSRMVMWGKPNKQRNGP